MANVRMIRRSFLTCGICDGTFDRPRQLPCLHNFCEKCLRKWIEKENQNGAVFRCPVCRHECGPSGSADQSDINKWVENLGINNFIEGFSKITEIEYSSQKCDVCLAQKRSYPATSWCVECEQKFCNECRLNHAAFTATKKHQSVSLADDLALRETLKNKKVRCLKHRTETINLVCEDCDIVICPVCSMTEHRKCINITGIAESVNSFKNEKGQSFLKPLQEQREAVLAFENDISERQDWFNTSISHIRDNISKKRQEYIDTILRAEHDMLADLDHVQKIQSRKISASLEEAIALKNMCDTTNDMIEETLSYGSDLDIWAISREISLPAFFVGTRLVTALKSFDNDAFTISITAASGIENRTDKLFGSMQLGRMPERKGVSSMSTSSRSSSRSSSSRRVTRIDVRNMYP